MSSLLSRLWFHVTVLSAVTAQVLPDTRPGTDSEPSGYYFTDTITYPLDAYKKGWTEEDFQMEKVVDDSLLKSSGAYGFDIDTTLSRPAAMDSLQAPDSIRTLDTFAFRYWAAIHHSACHAYIRDSLLAAGDTTGCIRLDSLFTADSILVAKAEFEAWYASLGKKERKAYDKGLAMERKRVTADSLQAVRDSTKAVRDSIIAATPRILESFVLKDSLRYQRVVHWTHERDFHNISILSIADTGYNYRFNDYPFLKKDVDATWLGVAGSPVQLYDFSKRKSSEGVGFYEAQESWSFNPATLVNYNTKTPYTELAYWGTLFAQQTKESDNLHLLTTQNITPEFNFQFLFDRYGGQMLQKEETKNKTMAIALNYTGKKYLMHAGYIRNTVSRQENGGILDNYWIRDTTVDAREIDVRLSSASSNIQKNTVFLDQQLRIPFTFIEKMRERKAAKTDSTAVSGEELPPLQENGGNDGEQQEEVQQRQQQQEEENFDVTTAFIGHSSEFSKYTRTYQDILSSNSDKTYYGNNFIHPTESQDSLGVVKFDNKFFIRLQPWADDGIISRINAGIGEKIMAYYTFDPTYIHNPSHKNWTSTYLYAGAEGQFRKYFKWDATGHYSLIGDEAGDFDIGANAHISIYPFRRYRTSPINLDLHFETSLDEPEYYAQHIVTNHFRWDNEFTKISDSRLRAAIDVPRWKLNAAATYSLLSGNLYYGPDGVIRQNTRPMSILSVSLEKNFSLLSDHLHLDHRILFQLSSDQEVVPLPMVASNLRYYLQMNISHGAMYMQIGVNCLYNSAWYAPGWNPALGVFRNQSETKYGNAPYFDVFINMQWARTCIFIKLENVGQGWPLDKADYFSADHYIRTQRALKIGVYWPFYTLPNPHSHAPAGAAFSSDSGKKINRAR